MRGGIVAAAAALLTLVAVAPARDAVAQNSGGEKLPPQVRQRRKAIRKRASRSYLSIGCWECHGRIGPGRGDHRSASRAYGAALRSGSAAATRAAERDAAL